MSQTHFAFFPLEFIDDGNGGFVGRVNETEGISSIDLEAQGTVVAGGVLV